MVAQPILQLDPSTIDQIAAGEVVERPASVVKELVENALDAGAGMVQVDLQGGGLEALTVTDDGQGMMPADARRAVLRYATSKLRTIEDLAAIATWGFRGEALAAIASVSRLTLTSRPPGAAAGLRLRYEAGVLVAEEQVGCPPGTSIQVADLFYNIPARRKFMRAVATEQAHCVEAVLRVLLGTLDGRRRVGGVVTAGSRRLLDVPEEGPVAVRLAAALGGRVSSLQPLDYGRDGVRLHGHVGRARVARSTGRALWTFVNGRYVRDRLLLGAVHEACAQLPAAAAAVWVLHLEVPGGDVDVNVHPQKLEVRFRRGQEIYHLVRSGIAGLYAGLQDAAPQAATALAAPLASSLARSPISPAPATVTSPVNGLPARPSQELPPPIPLVSAALPPQHSASSADLTRHAAMPPRILAATVGASRLPGTVRPIQSTGSGPTAVAAPAMTGILAPLQAPHVLVWLVGEAWLVDWDGLAPALAQRAAAAELAATGVLQPQSLMLPETLGISLAEAELMRAHGDELRTLGLDVDHLGAGRCMLRSVPAALAAAPSLTLLQACLTAALPRWRRQQPAPPAVLLAAAAALVPAPGLATPAALAMLGRLAAMLPAARAGLGAVPVDAALHALAMGSRQGLASG